MTVNVYHTANSWYRDPSWNWAHLLTVQGRFACRPLTVANPLPPKADDADKRCPTCASVSGPTAL